MSGLPAGVGARVMVTGPGKFRESIKHTTVLKQLRPGRYHLHVQRVGISRGTHGVAAGGVAYPASAAVAIKVLGGVRARSTVTYGTIRSADTHVLAKNPVMITGDPSDPSSIVIEGSTTLTVGSIIAREPSPRLPAGLFDRVTSVSYQGGRTTLTLTPATLSEAFPTLDVETSITPTFGASGSAAAHTANNLSNVDLSFSNDLIPGLLEGSCGAPPTGWSFAPHGSIKPTLNVSLHRGFFGLLYGELSLTVDGDAGFEATIPSAAHCDVTIDGPKADAVIPVAGIPVPVEGSINLGLSLALDGAASIQADAQLSVTGGVTLHGAYGTPILRISPKATGSINIAGGQISIGPEVQVGLGLTDINGHVDDSLSLIAKGSSASSCEIDIGGSAGVGLDLWSFHPSFTPINPEVPVYHCPTGGGGSGNGGGGGSGGGGGGGGGSGGGGRLLVYAGNASRPGDDTNNASYSQLAAATGKTVETATELPSDLYPDGCVLLQLNSEPFDEAQIATLRSYVEQGGVLVAIGEFYTYDEQADETLSSLAASLGVSMAFEHNVLDAHDHVTTNFGTSPFAQGITSLGYAAVAGVSVSPPAQVIASTESEDVPFIGSQAIGKGAFVMMGDSNVLSDYVEAYEMDSNGVLARNLCG